MQYGVKMRVAITGHTKGIGQELVNYFLGKKYEVTGFSRKNNYDISINETRKRIVGQLDQFDIFVNNAYNNFDNSQELLLENILDAWKNQEKIIINISSRWTDGDSQYCQHKLSLDRLCEKYKHSTVYLINLKPGLIDTTRVKNVKGNKMSTKSVVTVIDFILNNVNNFRVHSITFGQS